MRFVMIKQVVLSVPRRRSFQRVLAFQRALAGLAAVAVLMLSLGVPSALAQQSTNPASSQGRTITLADQLRAGLKATKKSDKAFIDKVVILVRQGKLPRRLVDSTFLWARERAARKSRSRELRPIVYFQPALRLRAKRIGVIL